MTEDGCRRLRLTGLLLPLLLLAAASAAEPSSTGRVFVDTDRNGRLDPGEAPVPGIRVSNGREIVTSDATGRYALPRRDGFVAITRPDHFDAVSWYARGAADFGLVPVQRPDDFFFVQVSDSHVYDRIEDFREFSTPELPGWLPAFVTDWLTLLFLDDLYAASAPEGVAAAMRDVLAQLAAQDSASQAQIEKIAELGDVAALRTYTAEFERPGSPLADVAGAARRAFEEVAGLGPAFIINTGDLILEGNAGSPEAVARWLTFYRELTSQLGVPVYDTIGNNEIAGNQNPDFPSDHPSYGKRSFQRVFGPTHYSFDRGAFHFVALDTHRPEPREDRPKRWSFLEMEPGVRSWLEADLEAHRERVLVVLNHEPFHVDPAWPLDDLEPADDEGLLQRFAVPFALTGHTHWNSFVRDATTTHITTGALSGMRWILPASVHARGYRLFYAHGRELHSAWKPLGEAVVALAEGSERAKGRVIVAADAQSPFVRVAFSQEGAAVPAKRWGDYFFLVPARPGAGSLTIDALGTDGELTRVVLELPGEAP